MDMLDAVSIPKFADHANFFTERYIAEQPKYAEFAKLVTQYLYLHLDQLREGSSFTYHTIQGREKKPEKLKKKLLESSSRNPQVPKFPEPFGSNPYKAVPDLAGVRVVTYFLDDLKTLDKFIRTNFKVLRVIDKSKQLQKEEKFGYLGKHYIAKLSDNTYITGNKIFSGLLIEIQIKTILEHAWAEIEHDFYNTRRYNLGTTSRLYKEIRRGFLNMASFIEMGDKEFLRLKKLVEKNGN